MTLKEIIEGMKMKVAPVALAIGLAAGCASTQGTIEKIKVPQRMSSEQSVVSRLELRGIVLGRENTALKSIGLQYMVLCGNDTNAVEDYFAHRQNVDIKIGADNLTFLSLSDAVDAIKAYQACDEDRTASIVAVDLKKDDFLALYSNSGNLVANLEGQDSYKPVRKTTEERVRELVASHPSASYVKDLENTTWGKNQIGFCADGTEEGVIVIKDNCRCICLPAFEVSGDQVVPINYPGSFGKMSVGDFDDYLTTLDSRMERD